MKNKGVGMKNRGLVNFLSYIALLVIAVLMVTGNLLPMFGIEITGTFISVLNTIRNILILLVIGFLMLCIMLMVWGAQYGILGKTGLFERRSTLPTDYDRADRSIRRLVGKNGKTISKLDLGGKAKIRGKIYDVVSIASYIEPNSRIKVVEVKDNTIMVRKWFE